MRLTFTQFIATVTYSFIAHMDCTSTLKGMWPSEVKTKRIGLNQGWLPFTISVFPICFHSIDKYCHF